MTNGEFSRLEETITRVLRIGLALSASVLGLGLALAIAAVPYARVTLEAGLVLLMTIPIARIVASFVDARRRGDGLLSWATAIVLIVMAITLAVSLAS
jgi:uncharacterized membrane protein